MMEEGRLSVAPVDSAIERSPLLGTPGAVTYNATGTPRRDDITAATIRHGTNGKGNNGDDYGTSACRPYIHIPRTHLLTILFTIWVS